jgi:hypothetical protein
VSDFNITEEANSNTIPLFFYADQKILEGLEDCCCVSEAASGLHPVKGEVKVTDLSNTNMFYLFIHSFINLLTE